MSEIPQEERLQNLVRANSERIRTKWALDWRKQGGKIIGTVCAYVPVEVIRAAGMLPWRITGSSTTDLSPEAVLHRPISGDRYYTHLLDARLKGELSFLDGVVFTSRDDDMRRLYDVWTDVRNTSFSHILFVPHHNRQSGQEQFRSEVAALIAALEGFSGKAISREALITAIDEYDKMRHLLRKLYELRNREQPAVSGVESLGITMAAQIMPVDLFNRELEALLPYVVERKVEVVNGPAKGLRVMVSSDALDNPAFIQLIEGSGAIVAMDDLDTGSRWFWQDVGAKEARQDPVRALANRYLIGPACARMGDWDEQIQQSINWAREYKVNGVIDFVQVNDYPRQFRVPTFRDALQAGGIPTLSITRDYIPTGVGQLKTRIEAFLETIAE